MRFLEVVSAIFGWIYTFCWSASFYTQPLLNVRRKSTSGTTVDFPFINTFGFIAYLTSNAAFYWSPQIRTQYAHRNNGHTPAVAFNDIVFAAHAVALSAITTSQYLLPNTWGFDPHAPGTKPSRTFLGVLSGSLVAVATTIMLVVLSSADNGWEWIDVVYVVSYIKLVVTVIKYAPQLVYNHRNRSTRGWSMGQVLLDFAGGLLSLAQLVLDSVVLGGDWSGVVGNPVKFALGNVSMLYDVAFMTQHYVLYPRGEDGDGVKDGDEEERDALLEGGRGDADGRLRRLD